MSFAAKVEKLMFTIGLTDKTAGPVGAINARIDKMSRNAEKGFRNMAYGAAGLTSAVFLLNRAMAPAIEQQRALNEVASLDVDSTGLAKLNRMSLITQAQFGTASADIVRSAYDIQSAISGLTGDELSKFTRASTILAKATKADAAVITDYMGTLYSIDAKTAQQMGKSKWVEQVAGQTAMAVKMYKTTGTKMQQAFANLGAGATNKGISFAEQIAVLGNLQGTVSGGEAGTLFTGYLNGLGKAEKMLGVTLTKVNGDALDIDIAIGNIMKKFGHLGAVKRADIIKTAFGSDTAAKFIDLLIDKTASLGVEIDNIGDVRGMKPALDMAKAMTDPWQQLSGTVKSVHIAFSQALLPVMQPIIDKITAAGDTLIRWTEMFPKLTRVVALSGLAVLGLVATIAALTIAVGIYRLMAVGGAVATMLFKSAVWLLISPFKLAALSVNFLSTAVMRFTSASLLAGGPLAAIRVALMAAAASSWAFTAALLANPITWIVAAVIGLGAAVYGIVKHWDQLSAAVLTFLDNSLVFQLIRTYVMLMIIPIKLAWFAITQLGKGLLYIAELSYKFLEWIGAIKLVKALFGDVGNVIATIGSAIYDFFTWLGKQIGSFIYDLTHGLDSAAATVKNWADFISTLNPFEMLGKSADWFIEKLNMIPGINIQTRFSEQGKAASAAAKVTGNTANVVPATMQRQLAANEPVLPAQNVAVPLNVHYLFDANQVKLTDFANSDSAAVQQTLDSKRAELNTTLGQQTLQVPKGGVINQMKQMHSETNTNNSGMHVEHVTIKTTRLDSAESLQQQLYLAVG